MGHEIYRVTSFRRLDDFTLKIRFDDGAEQVIDFEPVLFGPVFGPLRDAKVFAQVELIDEVGCLAWPTGADFDPETLRNWPEYKGEIMAERRHRFVVPS